MWDLKAYYVRKSLGDKCPVCRSEQDTIEHVLEQNTGDKKFNLNDERGKKWAEIVEIYRNIKEKISIDNIGEEQNIFEEQKKKEDSRRRQKVREDRRRQISEKEKAEELKDSRRDSKDSRRQ